LVDTPFNRAATAWPSASRQNSRRQHLLALDQGQAGEIVAVEMQEIEDVIGQETGLRAL
jgi:hypothetical protein